MTVKFPRLFPEFESHTRADDRRRYVQDEIVRMLAAGEFSLTACMVQRPDVKQMVGDVIMGHGISDGSDGHQKLTHSAAFFIPDEIRSATIVLESIAPHKAVVRWVDGKRRVEDVVVGSMNRYSLAQYADNWVERPSPATVTLREAWLALKRYGEHVASAQLAEDKKEIWRYREVARKEPPSTRRRAEEAHA